MLSQPANNGHGLEVFFDSMEKLIDTIEYFKSSPQNFILTYCKSLRSQIKNEFQQVMQTDVSKNNDFLTIEKNLMLKELDTFESECLKLYEIASNHQDYKFNSEMSDKLNEFVKTSRTELKMLHQNYISNDQWFSLENRLMEEKRKKLEHDILDELQMIKKFIFMNKYYIFKKIRFFQNDKLTRFGILIFLNEIFNEKILNFLQ